METRKRQKTPCNRVWHATVLSRRLLASRFQACYNFPIDNSPIFCYLMS